MKTATMAVLVTAALAIAGLTLYSSTRGQPQAGEPAILVTPAPALSPANAVTTKAQSAQGIAATMSAPEAAAVPVPVGHEFNRIMTNQRPGAGTDGTIKLHAKLESQPRDPVWAPATEETFRRFFEGKPELLRYGVPSVECRTNLCEVRLAAYGAEKKLDWFQIMTKAGTALPPRGGIPVGTNWDEQDGVTAVVVHWMYTRRKTQD